MTPYIQSTVNQAISTVAITINSVFSVLKGGSTYLLKNIQKVFFTIPKAPVAIFELEKELKKTESTLEGLKKMPFENWTQELARKERLNLIKNINIKEMIKQHPTTKAKEEYKQECDFYKKLGCSELISLG